MLALSESAVIAINGIMSNPEVPEGAGLRISPQITGNEPVGLELSVVEAPAGGDQVVEDQGAQAPSRGQPRRVPPDPGVSAAFAMILRANCGLSRWRSTLRPKRRIGRSV